MKTIINSIVLMFLALTMNAQQDAQFNQYIFNELIINPAYAGSKQMHNINATYSSQWTRFGGAPSTQTISYDGPIAQNMGIGIHFINDRIGAQSHQGLFGSYAYFIRLNEKWKMSFGLAAGISYYTIDGTKLVYDDQADPAIPKTKESSLRFDSKAGMFVHNDRFYAGFSVTNLLGDVIKTKDLMVAKTTQHYYLTAGYVFDLGQKFKIKPSFLIKEDLKSPTNIDINAYLLYKEKIWLGASVRMNASLWKENLDNSLRNRNAVALMAEWNVLDRLRIGYAYTITLTSLRNYSGHEIHLGYYFPTRVTPKMKTPRYF